MTTPVRVERVRRYPNTGIQLQSWSNGGSSGDNEQNHEEPMTSNPEENVSTLAPTLYADQDRGQFEVSAKGLNKVETTSAVENRQDMTEWRRFLWKSKGADA